ncbi:MAG: single-stranded-DNA-specific exonuclease RecJ, partial [Candidatus Omnitrophica bacterium]|nr:single-stranded-DNA-specific exonuclease RecJ [Candidatus Omnitrophota bacterium]
MEKIWKIKPADSRLQIEISRAIDIPRALAQLLINRGVTSARQAEDFLDSDLAKLHDPFLLKGMRKAVRRINKAIAKHEKIMIWGDYDIDGITSVALLFSVLSEMGACVSHYLPNRLEEGYGLNKKGAQLAKKNKIGLLITVDCGISAHHEIKYLKKMGIDVI